MVELVPLHMVKRDQLQEYWQLLYMHDRLKFRLGGEEDPTWTNVLEQIATSDNDMFYVMYDDDIVAEFALDGRIEEYSLRQIHFSFRPGLRPWFIKDIAQYVVEQILAWPGIKGIYGIIACTNKAAQAFARRIGFNQIGILIDGAYMAGRPVDGLVYGRMGAV